MLHERCEIKLINHDTVMSDTGFQTRNTTEGRMVLAESAGVKRNEFYKAAAVGMKPAAVFVVSMADYDNERLLLYDRKLYRVLRTYPLARRRVELTCEGCEPNDD